MLFTHKSNPWFMFETSKWLKKFNNYKLELEKDLIETIKKTEDFKNGLIEMEEIKISNPIIVEKIKEVKKVNKRKRKK